MYLGIDIGGTFTDLVLLDDEGRISTTKALTTPGELETRRPQCHRRWQPTARASSPTSCSAVSSPSATAPRRRRTR